MANKVFDPIGFTSPVTLLPKLMLKKLWEEAVDWDTPVREDIRHEFLLWYNQLHYLNDIEIPRGIGHGTRSLHTFCDASKNAYATVTFLRSEGRDGVELDFLAAKVRIAPVKATIPRLELLAALIGSRQTQGIKEFLKFEGPTFYWSDSTTVLTWLKRDTQWGTFVWNRVKEIRQTTSSGVWRYVPGEINPADLPSRGCQARQLLDSRWWEGPSWLRKEQCEWPVGIGAIDEDKVNGESKKSSQIVMFNAEEIMEKIIQTFSCYTRMIRFFTIIIRFVNFKYKSKRTKGKVLTYVEIYQAELKVLKYLQSKMFLPQGDAKLATLQTFTHTDGLIRLKTRIVERQDSFPFLYPILLDCKHKAVELLIRETHENMCHAGVQTVMCHLREKFWILSIRKTVRSIIHKCEICKKHRAKPMQAITAPLPVDRVKVASVFEVTGVDFAGPLILRGKEKAWICLYNCAIYRAVHLELVTSMSTHAFLGSLRRFIGRRGRPTIMYSDKGLNFVGADNAFKRLNWDQITKYSSTNRIDWRFNPPSAPWWGGWWERLIGLLKNILRKVLGKACLAYEEMNTVLCDCERTLNSRPLTYLSEESNDLKALTPAMFLHDIREAEVIDIDMIERIDLNARFRYKQEIMEHLRNRFRKEYLSQLIARGNVREPRKLKIGDVVMIGDDNRKRVIWPLARIEELVVGRDGVVRVAVLKTKEGRLKRPIQRLYPLELEVDAADEEGAAIHEKANMVEKRILEKEMRTRSGRIVKRPDRL
ncbi:uncharacterized protein LOC144477596 [Augochlora pura]